MSDGNRLTVRETETITGFRTAFVILVVETAFLGTQKYEPFRNSSNAENSV